VKHLTSPDFWKLFNRLPQEIQNSARQSFDRLRTNPRHPSLRFKKIGDYWSVRASRGYRALGIEIEGDILWGWIGTHADYDRVIK